MCGFTGWVDQHPQTREVLEQMTEALLHRGPDASGIYCKGPIGLGHRRLSIIDLAASTQPMSSPDGRYVLAYNGELYNFQSLRTELQGLGVQFITNGDTEVLLQALIVWGEAAIARLEGMFAFAFWDARTETLLLARDPLGIKPLLFSVGAGRILFASELKALLQHPACSREVNANAIGLYLECQYIPAPATIFQHIEKLPPAHVLRYKNGEVHRYCYWTPSYVPKFAGTEEDALVELEAHLRRSVKSMLVADVPIGAFVSGGIDSSLIASLMQQESGRKAKIFSIALEHVHSEQEHAARVASYLGAEFFPLVVGAQDMIRALDATFDEPFGDQAALPTLLLSHFARQQVKVVLTGEGADEVFAGYSNYAKKMREASLCDRLHRTPLPVIYPFLPAKLRKSRLCKGASRPLKRRYTTVPNLFDCEIHSALLSRDFHAVQKTRLEHVAEAHYLDCDGDDYLDKMLHIDTKLWLADDLLTKVDRATMTHSLEARVPYLDHRLVEWTCRLPTEFKLRGGQGKYLLKKLAEKTGLLPPEIARRPKWGFVIPLDAWMRQGMKPMLDDTLSEGGLLRRNIFRPRYIRNLRDPKTLASHATRLFALMNLELWFRKYAPDYRF